MKSILDGENRWFRGPREGNQFEFEEEKEGLEAGAQCQLETWYKMKLDRTKPRSFRHGRS